MTVEPLVKIAKSDDCEEAAKFLEELAAQARAGEFFGFCGVLLRPGGAWRKAAYVPHNGSAPEMIGYLFTMMHDLAQESVVPAEKTF